MAMPVPTSGPQIPVSLAEMLFISLGHVLDHIEQHGTYPPIMAHNIRKVLDRYDRDRTGALLMQGAPSMAVARYKEYAALKWQKWMQDKALQDEAAQADFEKWAQEMESDGQDLP
jgi:hypothetical protein